MIPRRFARLLALGLWLAAFAHAWAQAPAAKPTRILFIGSFYTSSQDTPARLQALANAMGRPTVVEAVTESDYSLDEHWSGGRALAAIRKGWDVVVLQQGPAADASDRDALVKAVKRFAGPIREAGAKPALLMVWPSSDRNKDFPGTIAAYRAAAEASDAILIPVGEAWLRALGKDRRLKLYSDSVRPASLGSDLTVLTIYLTLFPAGPQEFTEEFVAKAARALEMPADRRDALFDAATLAIDEPMALK